MTEIKSSYLKLSALNITVPKCIRTRKTNSNGSSDVFLVPLPVFGSSKNKSEKQVFPANFTKQILYEKKAGREKYFQRKKVIFWW